MLHTRNPEAHRCTAAGLLLPLLLVGVVACGPADAQPPEVVPSPRSSGAGPADQTGAVYAGGIESIALNDPSDRWSAATITLEGGQPITIPRNLLVDLPANRMTLQQFCFGPDTPANGAEPAPAALAAAEALAAEAADAAARTLTAAVNEVGAARLALAEGNGTEQELTDAEAVAADAEAAAADAALAAADAAVAAGVSGRDCGVGHVAQVLANRQGPLTFLAVPVIAGDVFIHKDDQERPGIVTSIDRAKGSFVINGALEVRLNDPLAVHSVQPGPNNGSPDVRYGNDPTNYTIHGTTGYPFCVNGPGCPFVAGDPTRSENSRRLVGGTSGTARDATRFEPLLVGDHVSTTGSVETDANGDPYLSAHSMVVSVQISTPRGNPDYVLVEQAEWDMAGWAKQRMKGLNTGVQTSDSGVRINRIAMNGASDAMPGGACERWEVIGSTAACELAGGRCTANTGAGVAGAALASGNSQVIQVDYDWDFIAGESQPFQSPAAQLRAAGDPSGLLEAAGSDADNSLRVFAPIMREIVYTTETWDACQAGSGRCFDVTDASGNPAQWGFYISRNGIGHPEWSEIDLRGLATPFIFEAIPWNLDRRLGPGGGDEAIATIPLRSARMALDPFPSSGLDPCAVLAGLLANPHAVPRAFAGNVPTNCTPEFLTRDVCVADAGRPAPSMQARRRPAPRGAPVVPALPAVEPATRVATTSARAEDLQVASSAAGGSGLSVLLASHSRLARARLDVTTPNVALGLLALPAAFSAGDTPGCAAPTICVGD